MHEIEQRSVLTRDEEPEVFSSLKLAEPSEQVNVVLDEQMLTIQGRRTPAVQIRLSAVDSVHHHSTNLVPLWLLGLGCVSFLIGYRIMIPPLYRWSFMLTGLAVLFARLGTKKPTLTLQTAQGNSHVLFGNDSNLLLLSLMVNKLLKGYSLKQARESLLHYDGQGMDGFASNAVPAALILPEPIGQPNSLDAFLSQQEGLEAVEILPDTFQPEWMPTHDPQPTEQPPLIPSFLDTTWNPETPELPQRYSSDHRPSPVPHPVLIPQAPPMHQTGEQTSTSFMNTGDVLPSFWGRDTVHIPQLQSEDEVEASDADESLIAIDAELMEFFEAETEIEAKSPQKAPQPMQRNIHFRTEEPVLQPRLPSSMANSSLQPKPSRRGGLRSNPKLGFFSRVRNIAKVIMSNATGPQQPSPFARTNTAGALREQAQVANTEQSNELIDRLGADQGGVLEEETVHRLKEKAGAILATAQRISDQESHNLDQLSFADLTPTIEDETPRVRELED